MPRKKTSKEIKPRRTLDDSVEILSAGEIVESTITDTLETNYMPYAMSVIVSRALPEIDGFKPSHRKLLYTMYNMGLLKGAKTKSANIVGQTMKLNPHGDAADPSRGCSSVGRAPALQAGGHGFESHHLHQKGLGKRRGERPGKKRAHSSAG